MEFTTAFQYKRLAKQIKKLENLAGQASKRMGNAAGFGDLRENAEFQYAEENRNSDLLKAKALKAQMTNYQIFSEDQVSINCVEIGTTVKVIDLIKDIPNIFNIVGSGPTDIDRNEVSYLSPIGEGLCGMESGEEKTIQVPAGEKKYKVLEISKYSPIK